MKLSKKIQALILFGVMGTSILTGCSSKPKKRRSKTGKDDYTITVGYYNCDHMTAGPVAESAGIYKDLGLNVKTVEMVKFLKLWRRKNGCRLHRN